MLSLLVVFFKPKAHRKGSQEDVIGPVISDISATLHYYDLNDFDS